MKKNILYSLLILLAFSSCGHQYNYLYTPNEGNTLALKNEKDLKASAAYGAPASQGSAIGLQVGYSPIKHLGIQSGFLSINAVGDEDIYTKQTMANLAIGTYFFKPFKKENEEHLELLKRSGILFDFYSGFGYGRNKNGFVGYSSSSFSFNKFFLQGGFHVQEGALQISMLFKVGQLKYLNGKVYVVNNKDYLDDFEHLDNTNPYLFFEGTWKMQVGKGHTRFYFAFSIFRNNEAYTLPFQERSWATGVTLDIGEINQKKKKRRH